MEATPLPLLQDDRQQPLLETGKQLGIVQDDSIDHPDETARIVPTELDEAITELDTDSINEPKLPDAYEPHHSFASHLRELIKEHSRRMEDSYSLRQIQDVTSEIIYSRPRNLWGHAYSGCSRVVREKPSRNSKANFADVAILDRHRRIRYS
ncbi:hypothetical protein CDV31_006592 [Fusarium ambrosium]|uniref:Uncharacterized protein n=1 Tax=Fusarium ambrosium TaxID=131363 RepID=A0A428UC13_9HYPO|nr:hypothetical protein CDV31_006592 [Fusarium ambrosium]